MSSIKVASSVVLVVLLTGCTQIPSGRETSTVTYQDTARTFIHAIGSGDLDTAQVHFVSRQDFMSVFTGDDLQGKYEESRRQFVSSLKEILPETAGAHFVKVDLPHSPPPIEIPAGTEIGKELRLSEDTTGLDNTRIWLETEGVQREMYVGVMLKVGNVWRFLSPVKLYPAH
jgi:hypothetical protein